MFEKDVRIGVAEARSGSIGPGLEDLEQRLMTLEAQVGGLRDRVSPFLRPVPPNIASHPDGPRNATSASPCRSDVGDHVQRLCDLTDQMHAALRELSARFDG